MISLPLASYPVRNRTKPRYLSNNEGVNCHTSNKNWKSTSTVKLISYGARLDDIRLASIDFPLI